MFRTLLVVSVVGFLCPAVASAVPVRATFSGSTTGFLFATGPGLGDLPAAGTTASFQIDFDDAALAPSGPASLDVGPVSGWLRLGAYEWLIDSGRVGGGTISGSTWLSYDLRFTGSGPTLTNGWDLYGLLMSLTTTTLDPYGPYPLLVGFSQTTTTSSGSSTVFNYATLAGDFSVGPRPTSVPEPATGVLLLSGLAGLVLARRRHR